MTEAEAGGHSLGVSTPASILGSQLPVAQLYREQFAFVWRLLRRLGVPQAHLDDAVQEVFLVLHRRGNSLEVAEDCRALLAAVATKVARTWRRSAQRGARRAQALATQPEREGERDPEEHLARAEAVELALALLDRLPAERREVFVMAELEGLSGAVIARAQNTNVNTVYSRLRLARAEFEALVRRYHEGATHG